jgi:hypothetical protein
MIKPTATATSIHTAHRGNDWRSPEGLFDGDEGVRRFVDRFGAGGGGGGSLLTSVMLRPSPVQFPVVPIHRQDTRND